MAAPLSRLTTSRRGGLHRAFHVRVRACAADGQRLGEWHVSLFAFVSATIGCIALAAGLHDYLLAACRMWERAVLVIAALLLIAPELYSSLVGMVLLLIIAAKQKFLARPATASAR